MGSAFVDSHLAALTEAFGQPSTDDPIPVSKVMADFGGRTAGDVRPNHALRAGRHLRAAETWKVGESDTPYRLMVALSDITMAAHPHTLVAVVQAPGGVEPFVGSAWRLPIITVLGPTEALLSIIEACGVEVRVNGASALFIARTTSSQRDVKVTGAVQGGLPRLSLTHLGRCCQAA